MRHSRGVLTAVGVAIAVLAFATPSVATHGRSHPNSKTQPPADGCGRHPLELITTGRTPQWAYVNRDPRPRYMRGVVVLSRPTWTDNFRSHDSYDMNWNVRPDPAYRSLLSTANLADDAGAEEGEGDGGLIHNEWEQQAYPLFAWPTIGDIVEMTGSWIWDCGHWSKGDYEDPVQGPTYLTPGTQPGEEITGEKTEFHPPRAMVVHRKVPSTARRGESVTDVVISSNGTIAHAIEEWAAGRCDQPIPDLCSHWQPVNDRDYAFDINALPKPPEARRIVYRVQDRGSRHAPPVRVTRTARGVHVVVPFKRWGKTGQEMVFAKTFFVGWDVPRTVHHYRVTLNRLTWLAELDEPEYGDRTGNPQMSRPPDEVNVYIDVAGQWRQLKPAGLDGAAPGDTFALRERFDVYVRDGSAFRIYGRGRECDQPDLAECPSGELGFDNDGGIFEHHYRSGTRVAGTFTASGLSDDCRMAASGPCYRIRYTIQDLGS